MLLCFFLVIETFCNVILGQAGQSRRRHPIVIKRLRANEIKKQHRATWNARTLLRKRKLDNIKQKMERMKISILCINEVRWQGTGKKSSGTFEMFYSGGTEYERELAIKLDQAMGKLVKRY